MVDDFGIKYTNEDNLQHLIKALQQLYTVTVDGEGNLFCRITLRWDYKHHTVNLSILGYIKAALARLKHPIPITDEHAPYAYTCP
eukprot:637203-Ditylum_brightwellii.AAC.1